MQPLLAADGMVPSRDVLLDTGRMRAHLVARLGVPPDTTLDAVRVKYRPGESLRVVYRLGRGTIVASRTAPAPSTSDWSKRWAADFTIAELNAAFWLFPHDRRLRHLPAILAPDAATRALVPGWTTSDVAGYAPEKCAAIACRNADHAPVAFAKVLPEHSVTTLTVQHDAIRRRLSGVRAVAVPAVLAHSQELDTMFFAPAHGERLADLAAIRLPDALGALGRAIACLHQSASAIELTPFERATPLALRRAALLAGRVRPDLKHAALLAADELTRSRPGDTARVTLHGDPHLKNAFIAGDRITLIDFDQACRGPAAADLGSLLAALGDAAPRLERRVLDGYASIAPLPPQDSIRWHTAAALLTERIVRAVTRVRVPILRELPVLLDRVRELTRSLPRAS